VTALNGHRFLTYFQSGLVYVTAAPIVTYLVSDRTAPAVA
jgi:hypothetical protein